MEARSLQRWWWRWWSAWRPSSCSSWRPSCCGTRRSGSAAAGSSPSRARWSAAAAGSSQRWRNTPEVTQCNHLQICQKLQPITPTLDPARILGTFNDFYSSTVFGIVLSRTKYCYERLHSKRGTSYPKIWHICMCSKVSLKTQKRLKTIFGVYLL